MEKGANVSGKKSRAKVYFISAYALLLTMALCWSLDNSIVLILFGGGAYFLFLGFYANTSEQQSDGWKASESFEKHISSNKMADLLKNIFSTSDIGNKTFKKAFSKQKAASGNGRVAPLIFLSIFGAFFIFILGIVFSSSEDDFALYDYFNRAALQYQQGDYDSAYVNYRRAWKNDENNAEAMVGYGNVLAVRNQYDSAALMYDKAFEINSEYLDAAYAKGAMFYNLERYGDCIAIMEPLVRENPAYYNGMLLIGDSYYALNQYDNAIGWYENAYENGGSRSSALCHIMAYIYDNKGDYGQAINLYQEALSYDSTIVSIYKRLGELLPNEDGNYYRTQAVRLEQ